MSRLSISAAVALGLTVLSAPAAAQGVDQDVRCLLLSNAFAKAEKDPAKRNIAVGSGLYYFGRVDARLSGDALRNQILAQGKLLTNQNAGPLMTACAQQLQVRQRLLLTLGQSLNGAQPKK
ncbi:MAG: hypothetical protein ABR588_01030 [Sphingomicrobium sp.]|nr:hypothetical protein [Sphingomonadales bacterium]